MAAGLKSKCIVIGIPVVVMGIGLAAIALMQGIPSVDSPWVPKCILHRLTGLHCPGCGTTRAVHAIANGRFQEAIRFNPLLVVGLPLMLVGIAWQRRRERQGHRALPGLAWTIVGLLFVYTLARNLPSPDRGWLAPPPAVSEGVDPVAEPSTDKSTSVESR